MHDERPASIATTPPGSVPASSGMAQVIRPARRCVSLRVDGPLDDAAMEQAVVDRERLMIRVLAGDLVVVDLGGCEFVNARGLRLLMGMEREVRRRGARLVLLDPCPSLRLLIALYPAALEVAVVPPGAA